MSDLILPTDEQVERAAHERRLGGKLVCAVCGVPIERGCIDPRHLGAKVIPFDEPVSESFIAQQLEPAPIALTDDHVASLERAIRAEGFDIRVDTETGEVKLHRARDRDRAAVAAMHNIRLPSEVDAIAKKLDRAQDEE